MATKPAVASDTVTADQDVETTLLDVQTAAVKRKRRARNGEKEGGDVEPGRATVIFDQAETVVVIPAFARG